MYSIVRNYIKYITPGKVINKNINVNDLGRWSLLECEKLIDARIDRSNYDHCGPCGINVKENFESLKNKSDNKK